jgi:VWFA-related protein
MMAVLALVLFLFQSASPAPAPAEAPRTVNITVVDEKGGAVEGLSVTDVAVLEGGSARTPVKLEQDQRPLTLALLLDTSEPMTSVFRLNILDAVVAFLGRLPEGSRFSVWTTGDRPTKLVDLGSDRAAAGKALRRHIPQGGNVLLDALVEATRDLKDAEATRAAVVVVTGMGPGFANYDRRQVVDEVKRRSLVVHAVTVDEGRNAPASGDTVGATDYDYVLSELTKASGGHRENVLSAMGVDRALQSLSGVLRGQYRLTYEGGPDSGKKLEVTVARPGAKVRVAQPRS